MRRTEKGIHLYLPWIGLALLLVFHGALGFVWIDKNQAIQGDDEIDYFQVLQRFEQSWPENWSNPFKNLADLTASIGGTSYPPFPAILGKFSMDVVGRSPESARAVSVLSYLLLFVVLFLIGKEISGRWTGLWAATIFSAYPYAMLHSRFYNVFALNALMIALCCLLLVKSKRLTSVGYMLGFGFVLGLACLTERGTPPLILAGPICAVAIEAFIWHGRKSPQRLMRPALLLVAAISIAWIIAGRYLVEYLLNQQQYISGNINVPFYPERDTPFYYMQKMQRWLTDRSWGTIFGLAFLLLLNKKPIGRKILIACAGLWLAVKIFDLGNAGWILWAGAILVSIALSDIRHKWVLAGWIFVPLVIFSSIATRHIQFVFAAMPALALGTSTALVAIADNRKRKIAVAAIVGCFIFISAIQSVALSFPFKPVRSFYLLLPESLRFANGQEEFYPLPSKRPETAAKVLDALGASKNGMMIYLPGKRNAKDFVDPEGYYFPNAVHWAMELQVWIEMKNPGLHHLVVGDDIVGGQSWSKPGVDTVAWLAFDLQTEAQLENSRHFNFSNPIQVHRKQKEAAPTLLLFPSLPGKLIKEVNHVKGRTLDITTLGSVD